MNEHYVLSAYRNNNGGCDDCSIRNNQCVKEHHMNSKMT